MHASYLWNLVETQDVCHVKRDIRVGSPNDCFWNVFIMTLVVWDQSPLIRGESILPGKKFYRGKVGPTFTEMAVIYAEAYGDVRQDFGIFIDLLYSKYQG